jgi:hypothetical protein
MWCCPQPIPKAGCRGSRPPLTPFRGVEEHLIQDHVDYVHTFKVADINLDGKPDVVFAEMQETAQKRVGFFLNLGKGESWKLQVVARHGIA